MRGKVHFASLVVLAACSQNDGYVDIDDDVGETEQQLAGTCTAVSLVTPTNNQAGQVGVPMTLSATATCPGTPEFQYWVKSASVGNYSIVSSFVPGSFDFTFQSAGAFDVTVVVRNVGNSGYDKRASSRRVNIAPAPPVNSAPVANTDSANVGHAAGASVSLDPRLNDTDADGDPLTIVAVSQGAHGAVTFTAGGVTYTATGGFVGADSFTYTIDDAHGHQSTGTINVTLTNLAPDAIDDSASVHSGASIGGNVLANDGDPDGDTPSVVSFTNPGHGSVSVAANGAFTYTASASFAGADSFTYTIDDGFGGQDTATVSITITNGAPTAADDSFAVRPTQQVSGNLLTNDTDPDGDALSVVSNTSPSLGSVVVNANGSFTYTAGAATGSDSFQYTVSDAAGGTAVGTVTINITNGTPSANADTVVVAQGGTATGNVLVNDTDPDNDTLSVTGNSNPSHGVASVAANGAFSYTPTAGYSGPDSFSYNISDGFGGTATGQVNITVTAVVPGCTISISGPASGTFGQQFTLTATAQCNTGPAEIRWFRKIGSGANTQVQGFSQTATLNQTPSALGAHTFTAEVRTAGTTSPTALSNAVVVNVVDNVPACTAATLVSPTTGAIIPAGSVQMLTGSAVCPAGTSPEFQYWFKPATVGNYTIINAPSFTPGAGTWNVPNVPGQYDVTVVVRSQGSHGGYQVRASSRRVTVQ